MKVFMGRVRSKGFITVEGLMVFPLTVIVLLLFTVIIRLYGISAYVTHTTARTADHLSSKANSIKGITAFSEFERDVPVGEFGYVSKDVSYSGADNSILFTAALNVKTYIPFLPISDVDIEKSFKSLLWYENNEEEESVWELAPTERGVKIQEAFGGNLPEYFPVIDFWDGNGNAAMILSIDITKDTYTDESRLETKLIDNLNKLKTFDGGSSGGVTIEKGKIKNKTIVVVIPEECVTAAQQSVFKTFAELCRAENIECRIEEYQKSNV